MKKTDLKNFETQGFQIINQIYDDSEIKEIITFLEKQNLQKAFGIRAFLKNHPDLTSLFWNKNLSSLVQQISPNAQIIKSIYFDKPPTANWIVNWHQDLTINLTNKIEIQDFKNWRVLKDRTVVQPSLNFLENIFTFRIHLDNTTAKNGALRVIPKSHQKGVIDWQKEKDIWKSNETICEVNQGGVLLMKPLLLHASKRTENQQSRRVIHLEFSDTKLTEGLDWWEAIKMN